MRRSAMPAGKRPAGPPPQVPAAPPAARERTRALGFLERIEGRTVIGWALDPGQDRADVEVLLDDVVVATVKADQYRGDLLSHGIGDGGHAFRANLPGPDPNGRAHRVTARIKGHAEFLNGSPVAYAGSVQTEPASAGIDVTSAPGSAAATAEPAIEAARAAVVGIGDLRSWRHGIRVTGTTGEQPLCDGWALAFRTSTTGTVTVRALALSDEDHAWIEASPDLDAATVAAFDHGMRVTHAITGKSARLLGRLTIPPDLERRPLRLVLALRAVHGTTTIDEVSILRMADGEVTKAGLAARRLMLGRKPSILGFDLRPDRLTSADDAHFVCIEVTSSGEFDIVAALIIATDGPSALLDPPLRHTLEDPVLERHGALAYHRGARSQRAAAPWASSREHPVIDIVICIYNQAHYVARCLAAIEANTGGLYRIILVDDHSDAETALWLRSYTASRPHVDLVRNPKNLGYTRSANIGIGRAMSDWVVLLNSDTEVTPDWLANLYLCTQGEPTVAAVGPLSNAATWQSLPEAKEANGEWANNGLPPGLSRHAFVQLVRAAGERSGGQCEAPILNGFCLLLNKSVFEELGGFDEQAFPKGYGEENDFLLRATRSGYRLMLSLRSFVFHAKSRSFGEAQRKALSASGNQNLIALHGQKRLSDVTRAMEAHDELRRLREDLKEMIAGLRRQES